jgi:hypothetical protein
VVLKAEVLAFLKKQAHSLPRTREEVLKLAKKEVAAANKIKELNN